MLFNITSPVYLNWIANIEMMKVISSRTRLEQTLRDQSKTYVITGFPIAVKAYVVDQIRDYFFVCYSREFVKTMIAKTKYDCSFGFWRYWNNSFNIITSKFKRERYHWKKGENASNKMLSKTFTFHERWARINLIK